MSYCRCIASARVAVWALAALLLGCGATASRQAEGGPVQIEYWEKWTGHEGEAMREIVDDFNASQNEIHVNLITVSQIERKIMLAIMGGHPPDVAGLWTHWLHILCERNALHPLDRLIAEAGLSLDDYLPVFKVLLSDRGFIFALPTSGTSVALYRNRQLFREAGLDPDHSPTSIAELDAIAERLTVVEQRRDGKIVRLPYTELTAAEKEARNFRIVQMGFAPAEPGWWTMLWSTWFGGALWDGEEKITADTPENRAALEWFRSYPLKYGLDNMRAFASGFGVFMSPQNPFYSGKIAMVLQGVWMPNFIEKYAPDLDWAAAPFPAVDPAMNPITIVESDIVMIPRGARHPREAFRFMTYLQRPEVIERLCLAQRKMSPLRQASPHYLETHKNPFLPMFIEIARGPGARIAPRVPVWYEYMAEINAAYDKVGSLTATPAEALAQVQRRVEWKQRRAQVRWDAVGPARLREWSEWQP
ncbi:MAG TPA: ABC transporter substrate-binding protein [Candidatus Sumerlaeota bacterium]|nr:ABC transporter substrate-binding protein [Candidatus Sumerlaeota bacterium]HOR27393.1 ABC transporter substrate-binding protein [Candidatus Sumerlaeota bacterium]